MRKMFKKFLSLFDIRDGFFFSGLVLLGIGLWVVKPYLAFIVVGGLLVFVSMRFERKG